MSGSEILGAWIAVGLTLFMYSFLYKDNPFFKLGEHIYVGVSMGYTIVRIYYDVMVKGLHGPLSQEGKVSLIIPAVLGLLMLARFIPRVSWLSRWSFAFIVGFGSGVVIPRIISSYILQQIQGTFAPFLSVIDGRVIFNMSNFNAILILIGVISVLLYFFFSIEHKGAVSVPTKIGMYFLMTSFGAGFGYTVMARMSLLIGRFDDLITYSSKGFGYATIILVIAMVISLVIWEAKTRERKAE